MFKSFLGDIFSFILFCMASFLIFCFAISNSPFIIRKIVFVISGIPVGIIRQDVMDKSYEITNNEHDSLDIAFLGSSHSYRTFDTRYFDKFGIKTYNFSSDGQSPNITYYLSQWILSHYHIKYAVIDATGSAFSSSGLGSFYMLYPSFKMLKPYILTIAYQTGDPRAFLHLIIALLRIKPQNIRHPDTIQLLPGGFAESLSAIQNPHIRVEGVAEKMPIEISDETENYEETEKYSALQLNAFSAMLKAFEDNDIPVRVVITPLPNSRWEGQSFSNEISKICDDYNAIFVDFSRMLNYSDTLFIDSNHFNRIGVQIFLKDMVTYFYQAGISPFDKINVTP